MVQPESNQRHSGHWILQEMSTLVKSHPKTVIMNRSLYSKSGYGPHTAAVTLLQIQHVLPFTVGLSATRLTESPQNY